MIYFAVNKHKPQQWVITYRIDTDKPEKYTNHMYIKYTIPSFFWPDKWPKGVKYEHDWFVTKKDAMKFITDFLK